MNYYNRHLSDILDIFRTFIGHLSDISRKVYTQKLDENLFESLPPETGKNY